MTRLVNLTIMGSAMPTVDYAPVIRAEIEREIERLKRDLEAKHNPRATRATVGYLRVMHRGEQLVQDGEMLAGLPVTIDRAYLGTIAVYNAYYDDSDSNDSNKRESTW